MEAGEKMKKISKGIITLIIAGIISIIDIVYTGNGYTQLLLALAASYVVFNMPSLPFKIARAPLFKLALFILSVVLLIFTFNGKVLLVNMLVLSYVIWSVVSTWLSRFRWFLPATLLFAFTAVYAASFLSFSIPLFTAVFFPVYALGAITNNRNIIKSDKIHIFVFLNLLASGMLLVLFMYKSLGQGILASILFTNTTKTGMYTAVYLPLLAFYLAWFSASGNFLFHMLFSKFEKGREAFNISDYIKPVISAFSSLAFITILTFLCEFSIRQNVKTTLVDMLNPNIMFNLMVLCGLYLCFSGLIGKGLTNILLSIVAAFLTIANFIKFTYFDEPFYPWDVYMIKNLFGIMKEYLNIPIIAAVSLVLAAAVFLLVKFRKNVGRYLKPRFNFVILPFALVIFILNANVLTDYKLSVQIGIQRSWYIGKAEILANGMYTQNYYYLTDLDKYMNPKPDGYNEETMQAISEKYKAESSEAVTVSTSKNPIVANQKKPNVIVIMSESYWDLTKLNGITLSKDIAENVHKYQKGQLAPPAIGGGTANSEFEALTGMSLYFMGPGIIAYNAYLRTDTPNIASVFKDNGYSTTAIHPNGGWFYNRDKVYKNFGFDTFHDVSSFDRETETKGPHISDYALTDKILDTVNSSDKPAFVFAVSMENHDPFDNKYKSFDLDVESDLLSSDEMKVVQGYAQGLYDADQSFGQLIEALKDSDRPTLVYFFGDHAPRLGTLDDYYRIYNKLGAKQDAEAKQGIGELKYYTTPLATWSNFKEMRSLPSIMSPSHLSYEILKDAGVEYPSYFNILPKLESKYPIMHLKNMGLVDPADDLVNDYRLIQYDLLFGKKYLRNP